MMLLRHPTRLLLLACVFLAACASRPPGPAPVETRTVPGRTSPAATAPVRAPAPAAVSTPPVKAEPVRPSGVQVRPLETRPLEQAPAARPTSERMAQPSRPGPEVTRTQPQGLKRPYSEAALAELRAVEEPPAATEVTPPAPREAPRVEPKAAPAPEPRPADSKASEPKTEGRGEFAWPAKGRVIQPFAEPRSMGISIAGTPGDPVQAAGDGRVIFSGPGPRGYGNLVIIKHDTETLTVYAHNRALLVKDGAQVRRGQQIAELGESGTDRPKLHFEIRRNGKPVDPAKFLPPR